MCRWDLPSGKLLYIALSFVDSSVKNNFARSEILRSSSSRHFAISPNWPLTLIMPLRIRCVNTINVFFLTMRLLLDRPLYNSLLFSSMMVLNETAISPRAMTMLLQMVGSSESLSFLNSRWWY